MAVIIVSNADGCPTTASVLKHELVTSLPVRTLVVEISRLEELQAVTSLLVRALTSLLPRASRRRAKDGGWMDEKWKDMLEMPPSFQSRLLHS
jgi:hypothetical protein